MKRSILAVVVGYAVLAGGIMATTLLSVPMFTGKPLGNWEEARPLLGTGWLLYEFAYSIPLAVAAGYVAGMIGRTAPRKHAAMLSTVLVLGTAASIFWTAGRKPVSHDAALGLLGAIACYGGGMLRERRTAQ